MYFFLKRSKLVNLICVMVFVLGGLALSQMNRDLAPPLSFNRILIDVIYPESSAADLENEVVFPIEEKLINFPGVKRVSSNSFKGGAKIWMSFGADYSNMTEAVGEVRQIVESLKPYLPASIRAINITENKIKSNFQTYILIQKYDPNIKSHRLWLEGFKNRLSQIRGIAEVDDSRLPKQSLKIDLQEAKMQQLEISADMVHRSIQEFLAFRPMGALKKGNQFTYIEFQQDDEENFLKQLQNVVILSNPMGFQTTLSEVAQISYYFPEPDSRSFVEGSEVYGLRLSKDLNSDIIQLQEKVDEVIAEVNVNSLGVSALAKSTGKSFIERQLDTFKMNGLFGGLIILVILVVFLSFKTSIFTVMGIPFCYAATFLTMFMLGFGIDILSVVGLLLVSGLLIDDSLIMSEKYNEGLEKGMTPYDAAKNAIKELVRPVSGTVLTTVVAFLPLILIPSDIGNMLISIPIVLVVALCFSLIESFFILPNHLQHFSKGAKKTKAYWAFEKVKSYFESMTAHLLNWKYSVSVLFVMTLGVLFYVSKDVRRDFMLNISDDFVKIDGQLENSTSKYETLELTKDIYAKVKELAPEKDFPIIEQNVGAIWRDGDMIINDQVFRIYISVRENHEQSNQVKDELLKKLEPYIDELKKSSKYKFLSAGKAWQNEQEDQAKYLTFNFYTKNTSENVDLKQSLENIPEKIKDIGPLDLGEDKSVDRWVFSPDFGKMSQYAVSKQSVQSAVLGKVDENWIKEVRVEGKSVPVNYTINGTEIKKKGSFDPKNITILTEAHGYITLGELGTWTLKRTPQKISHLNGYKVQGGKFRIENEDRRAEIESEAKVIAKEIEKDFPEHMVRVSSESLQEAENKSWILKSVLACIIGIFFILAITLNSLSQPLIVMLPVPFAVFGVMLMHKIHGMSLGVFSMIGIIGAIGVSINGVLLMCDQINLRRKDILKADLKMAVILGSSSRLRAIFLTSITTLGGLFPMAYAIGGDSGFTRPLAFAMAWGIVFASVMTVIFFPSIYLSLATTDIKIQNLFGKIFKPNKDASLHLARSSEKENTSSPMNDYTLDLDIESDDSTDVTV